MKTSAWLASIVCVACTRGATRSPAEAAGAAPPADSALVSGEQPAMATTAHERSPAATDSATGPVASGQPAQADQPPSQLPPGYGDARNVPRFAKASAQELATCGGSRAGLWAFIARSCAAEGKAPVCRYLVKMNDAGVELRPTMGGGALRGTRGQSKAGDTLYDIEHGRGSLLVDAPRSEATLQLDGSHCIGTLAPPP